MACSCCSSALLITAGTEARCTATLCITASTCVCAHRCTRDTGSAARVCVTTGIQEADLWWITTGGVELLCVWVHYCVNTGGWLHAEGGHAFKLRDERANQERSNAPAAAAAATARQPLAAAHPLLVCR